MSRGSIERRGKSSWRLKFDVDREGEKRRTIRVTVRGKRAEAERELARLLAAASGGTLVEPEKLTAADYMLG
jgi:hypothetical protein